MADNEYSSRFSNILNTNHAVSEQDANEIKALLIEPKRELAELDAEMAGLKSRLKELEVRHQTVGNFVNSHMALVSPFRRIPEDVLTEIFIRCLPTDRNPTRSAAEAPLLLTRINSKCRDVALHSPRLWSALHVYVPPFDDSHERESKARLKRRAEGIETWFSRSGTLPLNLSVVISLFNEPARGSAYRPLIHALASFSSRWGTLVLSAPTYIMKELEKNVDPENLSCLSALQIDYLKPSARFGGLGTINFFPHQTPSSDIEFTQVLSKAPEIRSLALQNYRANVLKLPITWDRLTRLELSTRNSHQTAEELFVVLRAAATSLESCNVTLYCPQSVPGTENEVSPTPKISFPNLHTLEVHAMSAGQFGVQASHSPEALAAFFTAIVAPSLTNLTLGTITPFPNVGFYDHVPFLTMLNCSDCKIENLLLAFPVTTDALVECLRLSPALKNLNFNECLWAVVVQDLPNGFPPGFPATIPVGKDRSNACVITDSFMSLLTRSRKNPQPLCPNLESVTIGGAIAVSETTIIRFVRSRAPSRINSGLGGEDENEVQGDGNVEVDQPQAGPSSSTSVATPLKQLTIHYGRETKRGKVGRSGEVRDPVIFPQLEKIRSEEGIQVTMTYHPSAPRQYDSPWGGQTVGPGATSHPFSLGYGDIGMGPGVFDEDSDELFDLDDEEAFEEAMMDHGNDHNHGHHHFDVNVGVGAPGGPVFPMPMDNLGDLFGANGPLNLTNLAGTVSYMYPMGG